MDRASWLTIIVLASAVVYQLSEAQQECHTSCTSHDNCTKPKHVCLGPGANKICRKCDCNDTHNECVFRQGNVECDCTNSNGWSGTYCKCPPALVSGCDDEYLFSTTCDADEFSNDANDFETIENSQITGVSIQSSTSDILTADDCKLFCQSFGNGCNVYQWLATTHTCTVFYSNDTSLYINSWDTLRH